MIYHQVFIKTKPEATEESVQNIISRLRALKNLIPEIQDIKCGSNFCDRSKGYNIGLNVIFLKKEDIKVYSDHPAHQEVVINFILPVKEDLIALDFEE